MHILDDSDLAHTTGIIYSRKPSYADDHSRTQQDLRTSTARHIRLVFIHEDIIRGRSFPLIAEPTNICIDSAYTVYLGPHILDLLDSDSAARLLYLAHLRPLLLGFWTRLIITPDSCFLDSTLISSYLDVPASFRHYRRGTGRLLGDISRPHCTLSNTMLDKLFLSGAILVMQQARLP